MEDNKKETTPIIKKNNNKANLLKSLNHINGEGLKAKRYAKIMKGAK